MSRSLDAPASDLTAPTAASKRGGTVNQQLWLRESHEISTSELPSARTNMVATCDEVLGDRAADETIRSRDQDLHRASSSQTSTHTTTYPAKYNPGCNRIKCIDEMVFKHSMMPLSRS